MKSALNYIRKIFNPKQDEPVKTEPVKSEPVKYQPSEKELEFRKSLEEAIKDNDLGQIEYLFRAKKPEGFDINSRASASHDRYNAPLMQCLKYGAKLEIFDYLIKEQGGDFKKSVSGMDYEVDGQKVPFNLVNGKMSFTSTNIDGFLNNREKRGHNDVPTRLKNSHDILNYIDVNTSNSEKNDMKLLHISEYFLHTELFDKLVGNKEIDINIKGARESSPVKIAGFDTRIPERKYYMDTLLKQDRLVIKDPGVLCQAMLFENLEVCKKIASKIPEETQHKEVIDSLKTLAQIGFKSDAQEKVTFLATNFPGPVKEFLKDKENREKLGEKKISQESGQSILDLLKSELRKNEKSFFSTLADSISSSIKNIIKPEIEDTKTKPDTSPSKDQANTSTKPPEEKSTPGTKASFKTALPSKKPLEKKETPEFVKNIIDEHNGKPNDSRANAIDQKKQEPSSPRTL